MRVSFTTKGNYDRTQRWLKKLQRLDVRNELEKSGRAGVAALARSTPADSGLAGSSWDYKILGSRTDLKIIWTNTDVENGFPVAIMLQYGYGTGTGGYVQGRDYINPAMRPVFEKIADDVRRVVRSA